MKHPKTGNVSQVEATHFSTSSFLDFGVVVFFFLSPVFHSLHSLKSMEEIRGDSSYCRTAGQEVLDLPLTIQSETDFTESQRRAGSP